MIPFIVSAILLGLFLGPAPTAAAEPPDMPVYVDLAKNAMDREKQPWTGKLLAEVLPVAAVSRILLLKAVTSATADLDVANIHRLLSRNARFENPAFAPPADSPDFSTTVCIWEAVVELNDGRPFLLRVGGGWALLVSSAGHGYFRSQE
ncbi:MAG: hypothetical protein HYV63_16245 [Candidatus Schekmanbacteria bacterium]|nr:hypothetical protein [Candidatus Schekmanbacteria bacterium]